MVAVALVTLMVIPLAADPVIWSWEQDLVPLDILAFVEDLPFDEWIEIDEVTCRRLFEDLIRRSLDQMELEEGGHFEAMLRERFFYFTPEREHYFPPYEEDFSQREVLFPVKIMRDSNNKYDELIHVILGRFADDERGLNIVFQHGGLYVMELNRSQYYPGETGPKKTQELAADFYSDKVLVTNRWFNDNDPLDAADGSLFINAHRIFEYEAGNPTPVVDNTEDSLASDLNGIGLLFDLPYSWHAYGPALFQSYASLIELCKFQLDVQEQPHELEALLWTEIFYYEDGVEYFGAEAEFASVKRIRDLDSSREAFLFDVGNAYTARYINLILSKAFGDIDAGYEWGIESVVLRRNIILPNGEIGQEEKTLTFENGLEGLEMEYWVVRYDPNGHEIYRQQLAHFMESNPQNLISVSRQGPCQPESTLALCREMESPSC